MMRRLRQIAALVVAVGCTAAPAEALTFVFVHGKSAGRETVRAVTYTYWGHDMINAVTRAGQAKALVVTYDGSGYYWDAAVDVAGQINSFLNRNRDEQLIFVAHGYGGLVTRFILCNASTSAPFYNYQGADFARINAATSHAFTLGSPHAGSEVADLGYTLSNSLFTSWIVTLVDNNSNSAKVLTTSHLAEANASWLRDSLRDRPIFTVAGTEAENHLWHLNDVGLGIITGLVSFRSATDGYVGTWSAHGTGAPGGPWLNIPANHDHARKNDHPGYIGDIIGQYGWVVPQLPPDGLPAPPPDPPWARGDR